MRRLRASYKGHRSTSKRSQSLEQTVVSRHARSTVALRTEGPEIITACWWHRGMWVLGLALVYR
jgi:hypothetical protein